MDNIYARLGLDNHAAESLLRDSLAKLEKRTEQFKRKGQFSAFHASSQLKEKVASLCGNPAAKEKYDADLKAHLLQQEKLREQECLFQEELARQEEKEKRVPGFIWDEATRTKNFEVFVQHRSFSALSREQMEMMNAALIEVVDYYETVRKNHAVNDKWWGSLSFQLSCLPERTLTLMKERKWDFPYALSQVKENALRAADAKIIPQ